MVEYLLINVGMREENVGRKVKRERLFVGWCNLWGGISASAYLEVGISRPGMVKP